MTSRAITVAGFALVLAVAVGLELLARSERSRVASAGQVFNGIAARRGGKLGLFVVWCWFGWHFLAR